MTASKSGLAALMLVGWLSAPAPSQAQAQAQAARSTASGATGAYPAGQGGAGLANFYGMTPNFANYGLSGTYPYYGGYGYAGYGPGAQFGAHYTGLTVPNEKPKAARPAAEGKPTVRPRSPGEGPTRARPAPRKGL